MTTVDFHILEIASGLKSLHYACHLIEKFHQQQKKVYVHTSTAADAERIDTLLWTYRDDSFIPHSLYDATDTTPPPIQIGFGHADFSAQNNSEFILLNLDQEIPPFHQQFNRLIEIVFLDPVVQQLARERFKKYRALGIELNTYKIKANEL